MPRGLRPRAERPSEIARRQVRRLRREQWRSQAEFLLHMEDVTGYAMKRDVLANIESRLERPRALTVEELFALAAALRTTPTNLVAPDDDDLVAVTPSISLTTARLRSWIRGGGPLPGGGPAERSANDDDSTFWKNAPVSDRQRHRVRGDPQVQAVQALLSLVRDGALLLQGDQDVATRRSGPALAAAIRDHLEQLNGGLRLLLASLEAPQSSQGEPLGAEED